MDCIFCQIIENKIPAQIIYSDESVLAFKDIDSKAPVHLLIIPKKHIVSLNETNSSDQLLLGHIMLVAKKIAKAQGVFERGYRVTNNCGDQGGQTVSHLHFHLLGGRDLMWPPG